MSARAARAVKRARTRYSTGHVTTTTVKQEPAAARSVVRKQPQSRRGRGAAATSANATDVKPQASGKTVVKRQRGSGAAVSSGKASGTPKKQQLPRRGPVVVSTDNPLPSRNAKGQLVFPDYPAFRPTLTPAQILAAGAFGGTYFRRIHSSVTGKWYSGVHTEFPDEWFEGLDVPRQVTSQDYRPSVNRYGVKCGGSLDMWEGSGWITTLDPYGWFQWYCRFYLGRRSTDDMRQVRRAMGVMGPKGRFRNMLIGKCARAGKCYNDASISPVVRQTLLHWGYELTQTDADAYVALKGLPTLPRPTK